MNSMIRFFIRLALRVCKREIERRIQLDRFDKEVSARLDAIAFLLDE